MPVPTPTPVPSPTPVPAPAPVPSPSPVPSLGPGRDAWVLESPAAHGLSQAKLKAADDYIVKHAGSGTQACLMVVKDGALVYERYSNAGGATAMAAHQAYSMTKTLGALIVGAAVKSGKLDIHADVTKAYGVKSPVKYPVTTAEIMTQSLDGKDGPGEQFSYDAVGTRWVNMLTKVVLAATGKHPSQIWNEEIAGPLGLGTAGDSKFSWSKVDSEWDAGSAGTCRDYARIAQLLLNKGSWPGVGEIISPEYIEQMTTPHKFGKYGYSNPCYGFLTWLNPDHKKYPGWCYYPIRNRAVGNFPAGAPTDTFYLGGMFGQETMVIPAHNAAVVHMGFYLDDGNVNAAMWSGIAGALPFENVSHIITPVVV